MLAKAGPLARASSKTAEIIMMNGSDFQHTYDVPRYFLPLGRRRVGLWRVYSPIARGLPGVGGGRGPEGRGETLRSLQRSIANKSWAAPKLEAITLWSKSCEAGLARRMTLNCKYLATLWQAAKALASYPLTWAKRRLTETGAMNTPKSGIVMAYRSSLAYSHRAGALQHECARVAS